MKKLFPMLSIALLVCFAFFATTKQPILPPTQEAWNIRYDRDKNTYENNVRSTTLMKNSEALHALLGVKKGWLISDTVANFFLGGMAIPQEDQVITIVTQGDSVALYSSGVIWNSTKGKYVCLDLFQSKEKGRALYEEVYGLIEDEV